MFPLADLDGQGEGLLHCPRCGGTWNHVDVVRIVSAGGQHAMVVATGEDRAARLDFETGRATGWLPDRYDGRRHTISLLVNCESCPGAWVHFKQHKGRTEMTVIERGEPE